MPIQVSQELHARCGPLVSHTPVACPSGRTVDYDRSSCPCLVDGVTTTYNSVTATLLSGLTYRPFGESSAMNMGNGGTVSNTFDLNGRLTAANPGATMERDFTYDANGHLLTVTAAKTPWVNRTFAYDGLNRLTSATGPFGTFSYLYDDTGNRLSAVLGSRNETYGYFAGTNRLSEIDGTGQTAYAYDADGNTTSMGSLSLAWNREGRLIRVESGSTPVSQYLYNAFGQRVLKSAGGLTTLYLYDFDGNLISETDGSGAIVTEYLYRGRVRLAMADRATGAVYTFHNNELGTPELMTDSTNTVVWEGISKPFGETAVNSGSTVVNNFRFQGQYYDAETGLHYNGQRYYDPKTGRYLTPDPIGLAGGVNPYVYVGNDPVNLVDPWGLAPGEPYLSIIDAGVAAILDINYISKANGWEYGGRIYIKGGFYYYTEPRTDNCSDTVDTTVPVPEGAKIIGDYHTHGRNDPGYQNQEIFSPGDMKAIKFGSQLYGEYIGFLGTPYDAVKMYVPGIKPITLMNGNI